jgi:hypothetical protein
MLLKKRGSAAKARLGRLWSRQGVLALALVVGAVVALGYTVQNAATFVGWSNALANTSVELTNVTWSANPANTSITVTLQFLATNPTDSPIALFQANFKLYLNGHLLSGSGYAALNPPQEAYTGHTVPFTSTVTINNATQPQDVSFFLAQTSYAWYVSGQARFHTAYADNSVTIDSSYGP